MTSYPQNYGLIRKGTGHAVLQAIPLPKLLDDYLLIKVVAVAINPTDWTTLEAPGDNGTLVGCDWAGIVQEIGPAVTKKLLVGDRVAGFAHGGNDANPEHGAFAKYIIAKGDLVLRIPDAVTWEQASTIGVAIATVCLGLYKILGFPFPESESKPSSGDDGAPIFIYGASTATGTVAIQFAKLSGRKVITTCSPKHFDLAKGRGADVIYDYRTPKVGDKIRADTQEKLTQAFDTVALDSTAAICADAIGPSGGTYVNLLGAEAPRTDIKSIFYLGYSISGERYIFEGETFQAAPDDFAFGKEFIPVAERLWWEGKWKSHPERVGPKGLVGVIDGMREMKEGKVSGEKLVYRVDETEWP